MRFTVMQKKEVKRRYIRKHRLYLVHVIILHFH